MNTKQYQYVLTLAEEGSFSKAAEVLNITQPSLSQYIRKIEKEIGLDLFDRTNGNVRLTDAGRVYIEAGRKVLDIEHQMDVSFSDLASSRTGSLIIGATPFRSASMMPAIAASFQKLHPGMHITVREGTTSEIAEGMEHGDYDLAITLLPVDGSLFEWEKITEEELILAVPASYPAIPAENVPDKRYDAIEAENLRDMKFVMLTDSQYMQRALGDLLRMSGISVETAAVVKSIEAQIEFVKAGVGMALVPSGIERFCTDGKVRFYSFKAPLPKREVVVIWRKDRKLSRAAEELKGLILSFSL